MARLEEWKSYIVPVFWHADELVADMARLNSNDNTSDFAKRKRFPHKKLDRLQIVVGQIWPLNPSGIRQRLMSRCERSLVEGGAGMICELQTLYLPKSNRSSTGPRAKAGR
jgi:hypothetical protein